jgi:hypothetical protein
MAKRYRHPNIKQIIENLFTKIAEKHGVKRPENLLSDTFDIEVYGVRQWTVRGIPLDKRDTFAKLAGITRAELDRMHGQ